MKYHFTFKIEGRFYTNVEAADLETAKGIAQCEFEAADLDERFDVVDSELIIITDENDNYILEK